MERTLVRSYSGDGSKAKEAFQFDLVRLEATGWRPVGAERRGDKLRVTYQRTIAASRASSRGAVWEPLILGTLLGALILVTWFVFWHPRLHAAVAASPASSEPAVVHCSPASAGLVAALKAGLADPHAGDLRYVSLVQSPADARMYFVAATIAGTGWDSKVGLWATDDPSGGSPIYAVNENAIRDSTWPDARTTGTHLSEVDDGADVAMACGDG